SLETARHVANVQACVTNEFEHDGVRQSAAVLRLYYSTFDDRLPRKYVDEHEEMIAAIEAGDVERADQLAIAHADQIV
ncbi:FCD domain-containing protein, partial [Rhizobium leguminosarum]|uniref:FCD domain-containing protein n=1 Tax=Rhizobium leguminosarum TaxID=384 RepID=UPI003F9A3DAA